MWSFVVLFFVMSCVVLLWWCSCRAVCFVVLVVSVYV